MKFELVETQGVVIIRIEGKMVGGPDATALSEQLRDHIEKGRLRFLVDMAKVDWMNSSGLGILIGGMSTVRSRGGNLRLVHVNPKPRELFAITKLDKVFEVYDSEESAIASFV
jgi:anti-sigma B factor antagonist